MGKYLTKHTILCPFLALLLVLAVFGTASVLKSREYHYIIHHGRSDSVQQFFLNNPDEVRLELAEVRPGPTETSVVMRSVHPGIGRVELSYLLVTPEETIPTMESMMVTVTATRMIFVGEKILDYAGFSAIYYGLLLYFGLMAAYFFLVRRHCRKEAYYSFTSISQCAAGLFFAALFTIYLTAILISFLWSRTVGTKVLVLATRNLMLAYSLLSVPFMGAFALALSASNVELIRHEGGRPANMLGIGTGIMLALGTVCNLYLFLLNRQLLERSVPVAAAYAMFSSGFCILQLLLLGAIISCLEAAGRKLPFGKQYIIILGCRIRDDGTLYPLLRGRVDRAISFWKAQYEATGERAVFVPSGGQGSDECISEGEAMKRYLLEQGIPEDCILPETRSTSTLENMRFSRDLIQRENEHAAVVFSTTNYHVFRSGILAREAGLKADGIGSPTKWYFWPNAMIREVVGMFAAQRKIQWLLIGGVILASGAFGYLYSLIS